MNLHWIHEPAARPQDEDGLIYEAVIGKQSDYLIAIYNGADVDSEQSALDGRTRYRNTAMICIRIKGERDFVSEVLTDQHKKRFPRAAAWWARHQSSEARVPVALLPGITAADLMELGELELGDVEALASADVPDNLKPWRDLARRFRSLSKPRLRLVDGALLEVA